MNLEHEHSDMSREYRNCYDRVQGLKIKIKLIELINYLNNHETIFMNQCAIKHIYALITEQMRTAERQDELLRINIEKDESYRFINKKIEELTQMLEKYERDLN